MWKKTCLLAFIAVLLWGFTLFWQGLRVSRLKIDVVSVLVTIPWDARGLPPDKAQAIDEALRLQGFALAAAPTFTSTPVDRGVGGRPAKVRHALVLPIVLGNYVPGQPKQTTLDLSQVVDGPPLRTAPVATGAGLRF